MSSKRRTDLEIWPSEAKYLEDPDFDVKKPGSSKICRKLWKTDFQNLKISDSFLFRFFFGIAQRRLRLKFWQRVVLYLPERPARPKNLPIWFFLINFSRKLSRSPRAEGKKCTWVPPPAWLNPALLGSLGPKALQRGVRTSRRGVRTFHLGRQVGSKFAFFRNLFAFFLHDASKLRFFIVSRWFVDGFWEVWGRFWGCFGDGFSHDLENNKFS